MISGERSAEEAVLFADNDSAVYNRRWAFVDNLNRKKKQGKYNYEKSKKLWVIFHRSSQRACCTAWCHASRIFS